MLQFPSTLMITASPPHKKQKNGTEATIQLMRETRPPFSGTKFLNKNKNKNVLK